MTSQWNSTMTKMSICRQSLRKTEQLVPSLFVLMSVLNGSAILKYRFIEIFEIDCLTRYVRWNSVVVLKHNFSTVIDESVEMCGLLFALMSLPVIGIDQRLLTFRGTKLKQCSCSNSESSNGSATTWRGHWKISKQSFQWKRLTDKF